MDLYMKEREGKPNADCQSRSPMPSTSAEPSSSPWGQARPMGASEAGGGKRGWWGQARPMGAVSHRAKSLVNSTGRAAFDPGRAGPPLAQAFRMEAGPGLQAAKKPGSQPGHLGTLPLPP